MSTSSSPIAAALVNSNCGLAFGYAIGIFAVINSFQEDLTACTSFTAKSACEGTSVIGKCLWKETSPKHHKESKFIPNFVEQEFIDLTKNGSAPLKASGVCFYPDDATEKCGKINVSDSCAAHKGCGWMKDPKEGEKNCQATGERWTPILQGVYSTLFVVGCVIGGPISPLLLTKGRKPTLTVMGVLNLVGQLMLSLGWHWNSYTVQVIARIISGVGSGIACVVGPIYAEEKQGRHSWIGCTFQIGVAVGIALAAAAGAILDPNSATSEGSKFSAGKNTQEMLQIVVHFGTLLGIFIFPIICFVPESLRCNTDDDEKHADETSSLVIQKNNVEIAVPKWKQILKYIVPVVALCGAQQLTGINAIMNFAPQMMKQAGVKPPLLGNLYLMLWNMIVSPISIPLVKRVKPKILYYIGGWTVTIACFLTFIPSYPGIITNESAARGINLFAIFFFVLGFAVCVGPCFFILAQDMFPKHLQGLGTSVTITCTMMFNVLVNFGYPVLVNLFAGHSNNQPKGQAFTFLVFGSLGFVSCATMMKTMPKLRSEIEAEEAVEENE